MHGVKAIGRKLAGFESSSAAEPDELDSCTFPLPGNGSLGPTDVEELDQDRKQGRALLENDVPNPLSISLSPKQL